MMPRLGLRSAAAAAALAPPPTARPRLSAMPVYGDVRELGRTLRRWCADEKHSGPGDYYGARWRAILDMRDLYLFVLERDRGVGG